MNTNNMYVLINEENNMFLTLSTSERYNGDLLIHKSDVGFSKSLFDATVVNLQDAIFIKNELVYSIKIKKLNITLSDVD